MCGVGDQAAILDSFEAFSLEAKLQKDRNQAGDCGERDEPDDKISGLKGLCHPGEPATLPPDAVPRQDIHAHGILP